MPIPLRRRPGMSLLGNKFCNRIPHSFHSYTFICSSFLQYFSFSSSSPNPYIHPLLTSSSISKVTANLLYFLVPLPCPPPSLLIKAGVGRQSSTTQTKRARGKCRKGKISRRRGRSVGRTRKGRVQCCAVYVPVCLLIINYGFRHFNSPASEIFKDQLIKLPSIELAAIPIE